MRPLVVGEKRLGARVLQYEVDVFNSLSVQTQHQQELYALNCLVYLSNMTDKTPAYMATKTRELAVSSKYLREMLVMMYEPHMKFGVTVKKKDLNHGLGEIALSDTDSLPWTRLKDLLTELNAKVYKSRAKKEYEIAKYAREVSPIIYFFLAKTLDNKVGLRTIQKMGLLFAHQPSKGVIMQEKDMNSISKTNPYYADYKYNGARLSCKIMDGWVECRLIKGQFIHIPQLEEYLSQLVYRDTGERVVDMVIDGELCVGGGITEEHRIDMASRITSATSMGEGLDMAGVQFIAYDCIPLEAWDRLGEETEDKDKYEEEYMYRRARLDKCVAPYTESDELVHTSQIWLLESRGELKVLMEEIEKIGGEGLMLKKPNSLYSFSKSGAWQKCKHFKEAELRIMGYKPHSRDENKIGSLQLRGVIDGEIIDVYCGSGLSDRDRHVGNMKVLMGQLVQVTYMDRVYSRSNKGYSITNPRINKDVNTPITSIIRDDSTILNY